MKNRNLYIAWGVLYAGCAALGFVPTVESMMLYGLLILAALAFFVPPAMLLYRAIVRQQMKTVALIRNLSIASLSTTLLFMILNMLTVGATALAGKVMYWLLIVVSSPMVCGRIWGISLFGWALLLMICLQQLRKYKKKHKSAK